MTAISVSERLLEMAAFYTPLALTVTTDLSRVAPMTLKEFCDETGYAVSKAHRLVVDLCSLVFDVDGEQRHFVAFVTNKASPNAEDRLIVINPRVLYGGHNFERVEAFALFFRD